MRVFNPGPAFQPPSLKSTGSKQSRRSRTWRGAGRPPHSGELIHLKSSKCRNRTILAEDRPPPPSGRSTVVLCVLLGGGCWGRRALKDRGLEGGRATSGSCCHRHSLVPSAPWGPCVPPHSRSPAATGSHPLLTNTLWMRPRA